MPLNVVRFAPIYAPDPTKGKPISLGDIFIGEPDTDPAIPSNQKQVSLQQENGDIINIAQPIETGAGGVPLYNGSPAIIFVDGAYSMKILDKLGSQVYYSPRTEPDISNSLPKVDESPITATEGQTVVTLPKPYQKGSKTLQFYLNGLRLTRGVEYTETDNTTVTMNAGYALTAGDQLVFLSGGIQTGTDATTIPYIQSGSTVSSTVAERLDYLVFVNGFGTDVVDFQSAIDSTPNSGVQVIHVAAGTYTGDMTTLTYGARTVIFLEEGNVVYTVAAPTAARENVSLADGRIWGTGYRGLQLTPLGTSGEPSNLRIQRDSSYTGGTALNPSALSVKTNITSNTGTKENAVITETDDNGTGSNNSRTALMAVARRKVLNSNNIITANIIAEDNTTRKSSLASGSLVALEIDVDASGPDDAVNGRRFGIDLLLREADVSADGATDATAGIRIRNGSAADSAPNTWTHGVLVKPDSANGNVTNAFSVQGSPVSVFWTRTDTQALIDHGSTLDAGAFAVHQFTARDSVATPIPYAQTKATVKDNTAGAADGRFDIITRVAGTLTDELSAGGGVILGNPTGGFKGVGSLNVAADIYKNDSAYANPDYVFEKAFTGEILKFKDNPGAEGYESPGTIDDIEIATRNTLKLPGMTNETVGLFERNDILLEKLEEAYLCIFDLNKRLKILEDN